MGKRVRYKIREERDREKNFRVYRRPRIVALSPQCARASAGEKRERELQMEFERLVSSCHLTNLKGRRQPLVNPTRPSLTNLQSISRYSVSLSLSSLSRSIEPRRLAAPPLLFFAFLPPPNFLFSFFGAIYCCCSDDARPRRTKSSIDFVGVSRASARLSLLFFDSPQRAPGNMKFRFCR